MIKLYPQKFTLVSQIILAFVLLSSLGVSSQTFTDSNLPIVIITTDTDPLTGSPLAILDDPKVLATMKIIKRPDGSRNYLTDENTTEYLNYNGRIGIELRGSTSQELRKKPYGLTTLKADNTSNNNVSILGMPSENDWILNSLAFDPSLIRDYIAYNMARQMGNYATRTEYCEVIVNGSYRGLYIFQEKIKSNENRVNVVKIGSSDIDFPNVTGGYITKADRTDEGELPAWVMEETQFINELPKPENATAEQTAYIKGEFDKLADNLYNDSLLDGYTSVIDVPSFVDFMLVNELTSNADAYQFSTFFHKDRGGKLRAGPVWDFNLTFGTTFTPRSDVDQWQFSNNSNTGPWFWAGLFDNKTYPCYFSKRWNEMIAPGQPMNVDVLNTFIDNTLAYISEAIPREHEKWGTLTDHETDVTRIKTFIAQRISWISSNIGSYTKCADVVTPPLVISRIHYNPATSIEFISSKDLEFIEIKNTGSETVNLSGIYLRELGTSYQFPFDSTVGANESLYLTSNLATFQSKYGFPAFGQYSRNFSDKTQKIVLADAYGNVIDKVEYSDVSPWPTDADGKGSYLQLVDTATDNNIATNWVASNNVVLSNKSFVAKSSLSIYPNPVTNTLMIHSTKTMDGIKIYSISGVLIQEIKAKSETINTDLSAYTNGTYFITVCDEDGQTTKKILKK